MTNQGKWKLDEVINDNKDNNKKEIKEEKEQEENKNE